MNKRQHKIITLSAPSGSGKTTIANYLLGVFPILSFSVSATTRAMREGEKDGVDYYFTDIARFKKDIEEHKFLEWEAVYKDVFYGTYVSEIQRIHDAGRIPLLDLDVMGGIRTKEKFKDDCCSIFIYVPRVEDLKKRLLERGMPDNEKLQERLDKANAEIDKKDRFDFCITNIDIEKACAEAREITRQFINRP